MLRHHPLSFCWIKDLQMSDNDLLTNKRGTDSRSESVAAGEPQRFSWVKLALGGLVFLVLTIGIFWFQFKRIQARDEVPILGQLKWCYLLLMLLCLPIDTLVSGFRILIVSRVLQPGIRLWTCLKAELANMGIAMLTPSSSGGGIGQVYMLNRGGSSVGTAMSTSLITFLGTIVVLLCVGLFFFIRCVLQGHRTQIYPESFTNYLRNETVAENARQRDGTQQ